MRDINILLPKVAQMAQTFLDECKKQGVDVLITSTYRTNEEQDALYAQGRTTTGNIVTKAKGGQSMHNYKVALDFCPMKNGKADWDDLDLFKQVADIGKSCGFEWGGDWVQFPDMPHLQYTAGYSLANFQNGEVDYTKFDVEVAQTIDIITPPEPEIAPVVAPVTIQGILSSKTIWLGFIITLLQSIPSEILPANISHYITVMLGILVVANRFLTTRAIQ